MKKVLIIIGSSLLVLSIAIIIFLSFYLKSFIEKEGSKLLGRQVVLSRVYVNPFTGYVNLSNLKVYELSSDSVFFSANSIGAHFAMLKLLSKVYEITDLTLTHPQGTIIQTNKRLNFFDLIDKFTPKTIDTTSAPVHFNLLNFKIIDGVFFYRENSIPVNYSIKNVNIESSGKRWDNDTVSGKFNFLSGVSTGSVKGRFAINLKTLIYNTSVVVQKFDLVIVDQFLKDIINYGHFRASLDADISASGSFKDEDDVNTQGMITVNDFHFGKTPDDDYASFDKLVFSMNHVSPAKRIYLIDSISLSHPYFKYERYDYLDNLQGMFGESGGNITAAQTNPDKFNLVIEVAKYIKELSRNFFQSYYKMGRVAIYNGDVKFNDFSLNEKFSAEANPLYFYADSVDKKNARAYVSFKTGIKPYGDMLLNLSINPRDSSDFDLEYHLLKIPATMFNPYIISYTSFPLDRGTIELNGTWDVKGGEINSANHLLIIDPRVTGKVKNKGNKKLPLPLIMSFIRERANVIDYQIPITGNLKDPKFHLHDVIFDLLANIFVKPPTTPYRMEVKNVETEIEKSLTLKWETRNTVLTSIQQKFLERMANFLVQNPGASITVHPIQFAEKEKEYILFYEARKKYYLYVNHKSAADYNKDDSEKVSKMSVKDSSFVEYLGKQPGANLLFTMQDQCSRYVGEAVINAKYNQLNKERENIFLSYFKKKSVEGRVKMFKGENTIPYNGFSYYKIDYKGEMPASLSKAYNEMNELNHEPPREKFEKERKKNKL